MEWKQRGEKKSYKARRIAHEANTSLEYGEKTWTTAQTVRDLMQNHLDAETERFYNDIFSILFENDKLLKLNFDKKEVENFLYSICMFASHVGDMTTETRFISEEYLQKLAKNLPIRDNLLGDGVFQPTQFLEKANQLSEHAPLVSYEVTDTQTNKPLGIIPYEALRDEPLYQQKHGGKFRFKIDGMNVVDRGAGYDSQLSSLYLSSKIGKKYVRGKFGEGAKMSELQLLRNKAKLKIRSQYILKNDEGKEINRLWQVKSKVKEGRLALEGVEIEKSEEKNTGSMTCVSFKDTEEAFQRELIENIDPRIGGLSNNVAEFRSQNFIYPMPISEKFLAGIDMSGAGDVQYVQGLRVELAADSFGYSRPWFSYDILDSSIIAGRDRNEIKEGIVDKIKAFWEHNDNPGLLKKLVNIAVHDKSKKGSSPELDFFNNILSEDIKESNKKSKQSERIQKIIDEAFISELYLEKGVNTLVLSDNQYEGKNFIKVVNYARDQGYKIIFTASQIDYFGIENFSKRISKDYKVISVNYIQNKINEIKEKNKFEFVEGEREKKIREVFSFAVDSVNALILAVGIKPKTFDLKFDVKRETRDEHEFDENEDEENYFDLDDRFSGDVRESNPIWINNYSKEIMINPDKISDPRYNDSYGLQRQIEVYLLSVLEDERAYGEDMVYGEEDEDIEDQTEIFKRSQGFLDFLITEIIPDDLPLLTAIPPSFNYIKDPAVISRLLEALVNNNEINRQKEQEFYKIYREVLSSKLSLSEAQRMLADSIVNRDYSVRNIIRERIFIEKEVLHYYNEDEKRWGKLKLEKNMEVSKWNELPVYKFNDGRFFVAAPMNEGAVLAKGEGKKREYIFNDGENFFDIGQDSVGFSKYDTRPNNISAHPAGFVIAENQDSGNQCQDQSLMIRFVIAENQDSGNHLSSAEYIRKQLQGYTYYPMGSVESRSNEIIEGVVTTAISIEYGKDEWDNPIRVFQDIIQNHIDASLGQEGVKLIYEVDRRGERIWVEEGNILSADQITGLSVSDNGEGYFPSEIATMGASSKKSPLFTGKYGEGQKMIAAASLRNGFDLEYQSMVKSNKEILSWSARAVTENRRVVLDGEKVEKKLVAFNVAVSKDQAKPGSRTILKLSKEALPSEAEQWARWVSTIDPRQKDERGNIGMARFVRQLRKPGSQREYGLGNVTILLDEPGAVYENGLRINPSAESGRRLAFGYDVPEIVTTRERNSYNPERLNYYIKHIFSHITDVSVIKEILKKIVNDKIKTLDLNISLNDKSAVPIWAKAAQEIWPGFLVHSPAYFDTQSSIDEYKFFYESKSDRRNRIEKEERKQRINANITHFNRKKILNVSKQNYESFKKMLPTLESAVDKLETQILPISLKIKKALSNIIAESTKVFKDIRDDANNTLTSGQALYHSLLQAYKLDEKITKWSDMGEIMKDSNSVVVVPIESGFHGKVDKGIAFNEALLLEGSRRKLAYVSLHEMAHIVSGYSDYTENFVTLLYEMANYFVKEKNSIKSVTENKKRKIKYLT